MKSLLQLTIALVIANGTAIGQPKNNQSLLGRGHPAAVLPQGTASLGAAALGDWLYVYSGHTGRAHQHSTENLSLSFRRLNLIDRTTWEELPLRSACQGTTLLAHRGRLYRVGGLTAKNKQGEEENLWSLNEFERYDPTSRTWTILPSLPEARSSHDAAIVNDVLFVVGGWTLAGDKREWLKTAWSYNLKSDVAAWERIPDPPFLRRALAVGHQDGKLFAIGGLSDEREFSKESFTYDPKAKSWSSGPSISDSGFGLAALNFRGRLYVNGMDGHLWKLSKDRTSWHSAGKLLFSRFLHRLVSTSSQILAVGGAAIDDHLRVVESVDWNGARKEIRVTDWRIPVPFAMSERPCLSTHGNDLYVFGARDRIEDLEASTEVKSPASFKIRLASLTTKPLAKLPVATESLRVVATGFRKSGNPHMRRISRNAAMIGVTSPSQQEDSADRSTVLKYGVRDDRWQTLATQVPAGRRQFGITEFDGDVWLFGGLISNSNGDDATQARSPVELLSWDGESESSFRENGHRLPRPRRDFGGARLGDRYYLVGGIGRSDRLIRECDVFNFDTKRWETIPPPKTTRRSPSLVAIRDQLFLIGGQKKSDNGKLVPARSIERFDMRTKTWSLVLESSPVTSKNVQGLNFKDRLLLYAKDANSQNAAHIVLIDPSVGPTRGIE